MMRSMYSGVSGLRNHQVKMDVIGNNIANVNTYGYKASRANFSDMFSQKMKSATTPNAAGTLGGTNGRQIGLGVMTAGIDILHTAGSAQTTDRALDICIQDEGFITVTNGDSTYYTRAGNLYVDPFGYLVTSEGQYVLGMMLLSDGDLPETMTDSVKDFITADQNIVWGQGKDGNTQMADLIGTSDAPGVPIYVEGTEGIENRNQIFGRIVIPNVYRDVAIDQSGMITALDENDNLCEVGCIITATFMNTSGLEKVGGNLYRETSASGIPALGVPGTGPNGEFKVGCLEMSNVDLSKEFTDMIVTQRGFQSNSRVITVSDTMLEELINLKR